MMFTKISAVAVLGLTCASCAGSVGPELGMITRTSQPNAHGEVVKRTSRINSGKLAGDLLVSNFYYWNRPQPATPAILQDMDARARLQGCASGARPVRRDVSVEWATHVKAYRIIVIYRCG